MRTHRKPTAAIALALVPAFALAAAEKVTYRSGDEDVQGYLALPDGKGPFPALVLVHEWMGQDDFIREKARSFAAKGYASLAVDLYRGQVATDVDTAHQLSRGLPQDRALRDLKAAFAYLASRKDVDPKRIGDIGWCMGGGYAIGLATAEPRLAATVAYYGPLPTDADAVARIKAAFLGNYGAEDKGIPPSAVKAFEEKARKAGAKVDIKIYPGAGHAFASASNRPSYVPEAAKDADARTDGFLEKTLKKGG